VAASGRDDRRGGRRGADAARGGGHAGEHARLLAALRDDELRQIALARMEGCSNAEIAGRIDRTEVTVERRLRLIRGRGGRWRRIFGFVMGHEGARVLC